MPRVIKPKKQKTKITYMQTEIDPDFDYTMKIFKPGSTVAKSYKGIKSEEKLEKLILKKVMEEILNREKRRQKLNLADVMKT